MPFTYNTSSVQYSTPRQFGRRGLIRTLGIFLTQLTQTRLATSHLAPHLTQPQPQSQYPKKLCRHAIGWPSRMLHQNTMATLQPFSFIERPELVVHQHPLPCLPNRMPQGSSHAFPTCAAVSLAF